MQKLSIFLLLSTLLVLVNSQAPIEDSTQSCTLRLHHGETIVHKILMSGRSDYAVFPTLPWTDGQGLDKISWYGERCDCDLYLFKYEDFQGLVGSFQIHEMGLSESEAKSGDMGDWEYVEPFYSFTLYCSSS